MLRRITIPLALIVAGSASAATNRPEGYETICRIGETCSVSSSTNVAFGASGQFVYKVLTGSFSCSVATFGSDPIPEKDVKECSIPIGGSTTPPPTSGGISLTATPGDAQVALSWSYSGV